MDQDTKKYPLIPYRPGDMFSWELFKKKQYLKEALLVTLKEASLAAEKQATRYPTAILKAENEENLFYKKTERSSVFCHFKHPTPAVVYTSLMIDIPCPEDLMIRRLGFPVPDLKKASKKNCPPK